jgi:hypothetical protein
LSWEALKRSKREKEKNMGSYSYRHWNGKAYQYSDTAYTKAQRDELLKKYRRKYKLVKAVVTDTARGKPDKWGIYINIGSMK